VSEDYEMVQPSRRPKIAQKQVNIASSDATKNIRFEQSRYPLEKDKNDNFVDSQS